MRPGERDEVRKRLLEVAVRASQVADVAERSDTGLMVIIDEVRKLRDDIAMLETMLRAARGPDDETMT